MRSPLLLVVFLALSPAARAVPGAGPQVQAAPDAPADWRRDAADERVKAALLSKGWRLEDDGKALDPKTKAPVTKAVLDKAVQDLTQDARRAALEAVNLAFAKGAPTDPVERARLQKLASELPPGLAAAIQDPNSDAAKVRAMANGELEKVAAYFDGTRTLADRQSAAQPVAAVTLGPRVNLPYYTAAEQAAGEKLRAAAAKEIGKDPFGRTVLARLNDPSGKPALPALLIEDQQSGVVAQYDFRRQAVVLDREGVLASVVGTAPPKDRVALRAKLAKRSDLLDYLDKHPEAVAAVVKDNDVVLVHELTHAWQDRRDPLFREIARGNIPDSQPLEYEEEAYKTKNLYLHSKLKNDPASVKMDQEFADYQSMNHGVDPWLTDHYDRMRDSSPSRALDMPKMRAIEQSRIDRVRTRTVTTSADQQAKALDLTALTRAQKNLSDVETAHRLRMKAMDVDLAANKKEAYKVFGTYYLGQAISAERAADRSAWLDQAERYAVAAGEKKLLEEIRAAKKNKP